MLQENIKNGMYGLPVMFSIATLLSIVLYLVVSLADPGYVKSSDSDVAAVSANILLSCKIFIGSFS